MRTLTVICAVALVVALTSAERQVARAQTGPVILPPQVVLPAIPGRWASIGPRLVTSPAVPALGMGPYHAVGRLGPIAINPINTQIIYVASSGELGHEGCGIWKTTNGGESWGAVGDSLKTLSIAALAIDPTNPNRVYAAAPDYGIYRTENGGATWQQIFAGNLRLRRNTGDGDWTVLLINPSNPDTLFITTDLGVLRSDDGGVSWPVSLDAGRATALVMDPLDPEVLYAAIEGAGVYRTVSGGLPKNTSWEVQPIPRGRMYPLHGIRLAIQHAPTSDGESVYALVQDDTYDFGYLLFRSTDAGQSWQSTYRCVPDCNFLNLAVDPIDPNYIYLGGPLLQLSTTGGTSFTPVPSTTGLEDRLPAAPHGDYHGFAIDPVDPAVFYAATDGGLYRSTNRGVSGSWSFISEGITNAEMYDLAVSATRALVIAGTQDNGNIRYTGSPIWEHTPVVNPSSPLTYCLGCGGDGGIVGIDPTNDQVLYAMGQFQQSLTRSQDSGDHYFTFSTGLPTTNTCAAYSATFHFQIHPLTPGTLLASCGFLWRSTTQPLASWTPLPLDIFTDPMWIVRSAVDAASDIYYAGSGPDPISGSGSGRVLAGASGTGWQRLFDHPDSLQVSDIEIHPTRPDLVYVSFANPYRVDRSCLPSARRIYQLHLTSSPPTSQTTVAVDITGNLQGPAPDFPRGVCVNAIAIDPLPPATLYAATSKGVYRGRPPVTAQRVVQWEWEPFNTGLPAADVRDLEFSADGRRLYAATYGRGAFVVEPLRRARLP